MLRIAVLVAALLAAVLMAVGAGVAQAAIPSPVPLPGTHSIVTPTVSYAWYIPARDEVDSGRGVEVSALFPLAGPVKGRLQYLWPQTGGYSNVGLAAVLGSGGPIYFGAGFERTGGRETAPVSHGISETQTYAFAGITQRSTLYSIVFEGERSFGDELRGTTLKAGVSISW